MNDQENLATERGSPIGNDYLSEIIKGIMNSPMTDTGQSNHDAPTASSTSFSPSSDILSALLSNPDLLSKLPSLISSIKPMLDMLGMGSGSGTVPASATSVSSNGNTEDVASSALKKQSDDRRAALLCAMKPYLSHDRQQAVDYILKLSRLGDVLKSL